MDEKRRAPRRRVLKAATIVFNDHRSVFNCTVRNLSETGALLKLDNTLSIPGRFSLVLEEHIVPCEVARRGLSELGVAFFAPMRWQALAA